MFVMDIQDALCKYTRFLEAYAVDELILFTPLFFSIGISWLLYRRFADLASEVQLRKRAENELKQNETFYRYFFDNANDIIYRTDAEGRFTFVNPAAEKELEYSLHELTSKHYLDLIPSDSHEDIENFYNLQFAERISSTYYEFRLTANSGEKIWLGQHVKLIMEDDQIAGFWAIARNITATKTH